MPPVVPAAISALGAGLAQGFTAAVLIKTFAVSLAMGFIQQALAPKPKSPRLGNLDDRGSPQMVRSSIEPHQVIYGTAKVSGPLVFAEVTGSDQKYLHLVVPLAGHEVTGIDSVFFNDVKIPPGDLDGSGNVVSGRFSGHARIKRHLGGDSQAADSDLVAEVANWTNAHQGRGVAYLYLRLKWNRDVYPTGIPNVTAMVRGRKIWDPRANPGDPSVTAYSTNAALCALDYGMASFGFEASLSEIHETSWVAAANICDETVALKAGGTQARYDCNGTLRLDDKPLTIMDDLLTAMGGTLVYQQGGFRGYAAAATAASGTLDEADLRGDLRVVPRPSRSQSFNAIRGSFVDADDGFLVTDFPPVESATYQAEDAGVQVFKEIELPFTTNKARAQRIGALHLHRARQGITVRFPAKLNKFALAPWDVVTISIVRLGWSNKEFRVLEWALSEDGGVDLTLQEEAAAVYTWDATSDETILDPAPDTDLPDPFTVAAPGAPELTEVTYQTRPGGGVKAKAVLTWAASPDAFLDVYQAEYKLASASTWILLPRTPAATIDILDITPGLYDFRVKALNTLGVSSNYTSAVNREVFGLLAPPAAPTNFTLAAVGGMALLRWDRHPELDVRIGGKIAFRHSSAQVGATWQASVSIGDPVDGADTIATLPLKPGTYLAKAIDSSSVSSATVATAATKGAQALAFANLDTIDEHPTFVGTHSVTVADGGKLKLAGAGPFDDIPDLDAVGDLDGYGGVALSGFYDFSAGIDLGGVKVVRLRSEITVSIVNALDKIDDRSALIDDWEDFDGAITASGDAQVWVRETDDDPAGAPSWSAYHRLDAAEYQARGFDFQARLSVDDPAYNIQVSALTVTADEVV